MKGTNVQVNNINNRADSEKNDCTGQWWKFIHYLKQLKNYSPLLPHSFN